MAVFTEWKSAVVLITGASRGIGRELAKAAALRGAKLGLIARSLHQLEDVLLEIGGQGVIQQADVGNPIELKTAIDFIVSKLGAIDVLINCAGIGAFGSFRKTDRNVFESLMQVNYLGTVYAMKSVLPSMLLRQRGTIVNIVSVSGRIGAPFEAAYSASKFAVVGLSEAVQQEVKSRGVQVLIINPGPVETSFFETRGHSYAFNHPKPISKNKVVGAIIKAIENGREEVFIPSWFNFAYISKTLIPKLYHAGINRLFRNQIKSEYSD